MITALTTCSEHSWRQHRPSTLESAQRKSRIRRSSAVIGVQQVQTACDTSQKSLAPELQVFILLHKLFPRRRTLFGESATALDL